MIKLVYNKRSTKGHHKNFNPAKNDWKNGHLKANKANSWNYRNEKTYISKKNNKNYFK